MALFYFVANYRHKNLGNCLFSGSNGCRVNLMVEELRNISYSQQALLSDLKILCRLSPGTSSHSQPPNSQWMSSSTFYYILSLRLQLCCDCSPLHLVFNPTDELHGSFHSSPSIFITTALCEKE